MYLGHPGKKQKQNKTKKREKGKLLATCIICGFRLVVVNKVGIEISGGDSEETTGQMGGQGDTANK
jgi:hypothetical protein